jgi:hypothetical protein
VDDADPARAERGRAGRSGEEPRAVRELTAELEPRVFELACAEQRDELLARLLAAFRVAPAAPIADAIRAVSAIALDDVPPTTIASDGHRAQKIARRIRAATPFRVLPRSPQPRSCLIAVAQSSR